MTIRTEQRAGVLRIGFDRAERKNAITAAMYAQLARALGEASEDPAVRAVLLHGADAVFTAGNDLDDFLKNPPHGTDSPVFAFLSALRSVDKPLVAAVAGPAIGVGATMLLHCDLVYAADHAKFSFPFVQLGLCPEAASSLLLPMVAGWQRASEKLLLGEAFGADEAHALGFVNRVLSAAELMPFVDAQLAKLVALPAAALRTTKRLMKSGLRDAIAARMDDEGDQFRSMLASPEAKEAFAAFFEKRRPDFSKLA